jgi:hypothetical protein
MELGIRLSFGKNSEFRGGLNAPPPFGTPLLHECLSRVVFMQQRYKLLQVLPADDGNSSGRRLFLVTWCPHMPKVYMTALPLNFTACTFMNFTSVYSPKGV